jgi:hypothetical protein
LCVALEKLTNTSSNGFHRSQITMNNSQESAIADLKVTTTLLNLKVIRHNFIYSISIQLTTLAFKK